MGICHIDTLRCSRRLFRLTNEAIGLLFARERTDRVHVAPGKERYVCTCAETSNSPWKLG